MRRRPALHKNGWREKKKIQIQRNFDEKNKKKKTTTMHEYVTKKNIKEKSKTKRKKNEHAPREIGSTREIWSGRSVGKRTEGVVRRVRII